MTFEKILRFQGKQCRVTVHENLQFTQFQGKLRVRPDCFVFVDDESEIGVLLYPDQILDIQLSGQTVAPTILVPVSA